MKAFVTGVAGFAGGHLARHLLDRDDKVAGIRQPGDRKPGEDSPPPDVPDVPDVEVHEADILDATSLARIVSDFKPEAIYHLAAFSNPEGSWANARRALETNIIGSHNVLQAALETGMRPRVLLVGSAQQYGLVPEGEQPIGEDRPQRPLTPYGVSKTAQEVLGPAFLSRGGASRFPGALVQPYRPRPGILLCLLELRTPGGGDRSRASGPYDSSRKLVRPPRLQRCS